MARLILKWRYIKSGTQKHGKNLVKYIATRDGVERCDESWKNQNVTVRQERIIKELVKDFPNAKDSHEYQDYLKSKTKYTASEFINRAIEDNLDLIGKKENYVEYIAKRPRVEKDGKHGLFTENDEPINLDKIAERVANHDGLVWTTVLSLRREDAERLGYDNAKQWKDLLRSQADNLAESMGIPLEDLKWYAAFHNEGHHPHVHIVSYSEGKEPYMTEQGLKRMKEKFAREIFKNDLYNAYVKQTEYRDELRKLGKERIAEIVSQVNNGKYENETVEIMLTKLAKTLEGYNGKKVYGYLSPTAKNLVDGIVDELAKDERIAEMYDFWYEQKDGIVRVYQDEKNKRVPLSKNDEFKSIRNAVIKEAVMVMLDRERIEEQDETEKHGELYDEEMEKTMTPREQNKKSWDAYRQAKELLIKENVEYNPTKAVKLFEMSATLGNPIAKYQLGKLYYVGEHTEKDIDEALKWLEESVTDKNPYAEYLLGKIYLQGIDTDRNVERAKQLLQNSAEQGNQYAEYLLGKTLYKGELLDKDIIQAVEYLERSAKKGNANAAYLVGKIRLTEGELKDIDKAIRYFEIAASKGNDFAEFQLGRLYYFGKEVAKDEEKGMEWFKKSAEHGNGYAEKLIESIQTNRKWSVGVGVSRLFNHVARVFQDKLDEQNKRSMGRVDKKLRRKIDEKKQAHGIKYE